MRPSRASVTPARINYSLDFYFDMRDKGNSPGDASWATKDYGQLSMVLKKEFRKQYGDAAFEEIRPSGLKLLPKWDAKFNTIPIIINEETKKDPPYDINGNGNPFTGINPTVIAELTNT